MKVLYCSWYENSKKDMVKALDTLADEVFVIEHSVKEYIGDNKEVEYEVIETEPAVKGNTATNASKDAKIETGYVVKVPLFINEGEKIIISTKDGKYSGRA